MTGLTTWAALARMVDRRGYRPFALLVLDLNDFRLVNDALGFSAGDRLLGEVAQRLVAVPGPMRVVARLGADRYVIVLPEVADAEGARAGAQRFAAALHEPVTVDGLPVEVSAAVGVAVAPGDGADSETVLRNAERAMYDAKRRGEAVAGYLPGADLRAEGRLRLLADLRRTVTDPTDTSVGLYYQPQIDLRTGAVVGVEALLRWHHPQRGPVDPNEVIRAAEHSPVMRLLSMRVVDDAVNQFGRWGDKVADLRLSINVSMRDLLGGELIDRLVDRLTERAVPASRVQLEITESALMTDPRAVLSSLARLQRLGVGVSLDDFGTGYSSLAHLRRLPLTEVKIDRSFVHGAGSATVADTAVVRAIVGLADALGLRVVAEGVEDETTWRALVTAGCHVAQGWYGARPMPPEQLLGWLADYTGRTRVPGAE
ncbi:hypothetical protein Val02_25620 [Virgisporangium aliadipatigenens]|uniref:Diguanylate cyclase/phosphodiesterase n=1 Tax=Virgisporangium aliadipatigenens TaxID=741659 RepID=A0A8J3YIG4_9ACTN|nr:hypothetical protein Val02_25620 [Virgisporangium aliadipatigenens]